MRKLHLPEMSLSRAGDVVAEKETSDSPDFLILHLCTHSICTNSMGLGLLSPRLTGNERQW
ncbi:hypothetical protein Nmel_004617 [Mimus melanotis]